MIKIFDSFADIFFSFCKHDSLTGKRRKKKMRLKMKIYIFEQMKENFLITSH